MSTSLEQSILKTLCWFSVTDYPVTGFEIWKWLLEPDRVYDLSEVYRVLELSEWLRFRMMSIDGHYSLRQEVPSSLSVRQEHYLDATRKYKKLRRAARFFSLFESVRAVAAVNSIAWWNTNASSDIDLFIITKPGSIWSARFWIVAPFILFGIRPHTESANVQDPFCFSFFASRSALKMEPLRLKEGDHYFAFWAKSIVPLFDRDGSIESFHRANVWAHTQLPNVSIRHSSVPSFAPVRHSGLFESFYRSVQQKRFPNSIRSIANKDSRVVITDDILKFHDLDRRAEFQKKYEETFKRVCA